jgi:hypothetical protein
VLRDRVSFSTSNSAQQPTAWFVLSSKPGVVRIVVSELHPWLEGARAQFTIYYPL